MWPRPRCEVHLRRQAISMLACSFPRLGAFYMVIVECCHQATAFPWLDMLRYMQGCRRLRMAFAFRTYSTCVLASCSPRWWRWPCPLSRYVRPPPASRLRMMFGSEFVAWTWSCNGLHACGTRFLFHKQHMLGPRPNVRAMLAFGVPRCLVLLLSMVAYLDNAASRHATCACRVAALRHHASKTLTPWRSSLESAR